MGVGTFCSSVLPRVVNPRTLTCAKHPCSHDADWLLEWPSLQEFTGSDSVLEIQTRLLPIPKRLMLSKILHCESIGIIWWQIWNVFDALTAWLKCCFSPEHHSKHFVDLAISTVFVDFAHWHPGSFLLISSRAPSPNISSPSCNAICSD